MAEKNTLYTEGMTPEQFETVVGIFTGMASEAGKKTTSPYVPKDELEELNDKAVKSLHEYLIEYIEDIPGWAVSIAMEDAFRIIDLFSIEGEYEFRESGKTTPIIHLMNFLLTASSHEREPATEFNITSIATSTLLELENAGCTSPIFLYHLEGYNDSLGIELDDEEEEEDIEWV